LLTIKGCDVEAKEDDGLAEVSKEDLDAAAAAAAAAATSTGSPRSNALLDLDELGDTQGIRMREVDAESEQPDNDDASSHESLHHSITGSKREADGLLELPASKRARHSAPGDDEQDAD